MLQRFWTLASSTYVETIRQPIFGVILGVTALMLLLNVSLAAFTLEDDNKLLLDLGLSTLLLSGLFLAAFCASGILGREIENKTVLTVISKPVSRPLFIVGKFTGLIGAITTAFYISFLVFVLALRHGVLQQSSDPWDQPVLVGGGAAMLTALMVAMFANYFYGKHFASTAVGLTSALLTLAVIVVACFGKSWERVSFGQDLPGGQVIIAAYFVLLLNIVIAAVAVAASTRFGQVLTLLTCTCILALGIMNDYLFAERATQSVIAKVGYRILPNVGPFWLIDGLTSGSAETTATGEYVMLVTGYALLLTIGAIGLAVAAFQRREIG